MSKRKNQARRHAQTVDDQEDVFVAKAIEASAWAQSNQQRLTMVLVMVGIIVAGGLYLISFRSGQRDQATVRLEGIHQAISIGAVEDAKLQLGTFLDAFAGTPQAKEGVVLLARLHLESGDASVAVNVLENEAPGFGAGIEIQANLLLARAYEQEGRWPDAERLYLRIADGAELEFQIIESLENAARTRFRQQDTSGAAEIYGRILATLDDDDPSRGVYEMRRAEMLQMAS